ncbi:HNH endonuclease [Phenylobacterium montanum]|uniref:HNH endonuclease n=1 Tax=Phenylobacterium montanum TaxID=2823693 RepID=A0A975ISW4_9CAUL|nr:HNH endonuclease [Caulobacter sp. S6]QUD86237.1 HNH endonuclease [Caulobacter sp. S6]
MADTIRRRPRQNFFEMGLKPGDRVVLEQHPDELVVVENDRQLRWRGRLISLTALRQAIGQRRGLTTYSGRITANGIDLDQLYDETYGPARIAEDLPEELRPKGAWLTFAEVVGSPDNLMGVKAVWGKSSAPVMCFGSRGDPSAKDTLHFSLAHNVAKKSISQPFMVTIGGGEQVTADLRGRVLELVRVSGAYGETAAFVSDPELSERLAQWPVAVVLTEVYAIEDDPDLIEDLGFPDRRILANAYDGVKRNDADIDRLWAALKDRRLALRHDVPALPGFADPGKVVQVSTLFPKVKATEGERRYKAALQIERSGDLAREAKRANRERNGGVLVCEACDFSDEKSALFDAHHVEPLALGVRETTISHLAILCPTCHRWAHHKALHVTAPLTVSEVRAARFLEPTSAAGDQ